MATRSRERSPTQSGPIPGPAPQFRVPNISATAVTPQLLVARWVMFVAVMAAIGLFVMRLLTARPLVREVEGATLRALSVAFTVSAVVGLIAIPVYLDFATANDTLRSAFDLSALVPLFRVTAFGRAIVDLEVCFALFCVAAGIALWVDRPERPRRSVAELIASCGALLAAAAVWWCPGAAGHAAQTSPRGLTLLFDWLHVASGSVWLGGLVGLLVLWFERDLARASGRAVGLRATFLERRGRVGRRARRDRRRRGDQSHAGGQRAVGDELRSGDPGQGGAARRRDADRVREPAPLASAADRRARRPEVGEPAARLLRRLVSGELVVVVGVVFAAAVLSSLASASARVRARELGDREGRPGSRRRDGPARGLILQVLVSPNKAAAPDSFALRITKGGQPVRGANVTLLFNHLEMQMPTQEYQLTETQPGHLLACRAGIGDGRPLGADVPGNPEARPAVHRTDRRPGRRMKPLTLTDQRRRSP